MQQSATCPSQPEQLETTQNQSQAEHTQQSEETPLQSAKRPIKNEDDEGLWMGVYDKQGQEDMESQRVREDTAWRQDIEKQPEK